MNDKQKQIEEMAYSVCKMGEISDYITDCSKCGYNDERDCKVLKFAQKFYAAGYRKQSDTAREILKWLKLLYSERQKEYTNWDGNKISAVTTEWLNSDIETIAAEYGVEVEE